VPIGCPWRIKPNRVLTVLNVGHLGWFDEYKHRLRVDKTAD